MGIDAGLVAGERRTRRRGQLDTDRALQLLNAWSFAGIGVSGDIG
jgi:hypothetical protein